MVDPDGLTWGAGKTQIIAHCRSVQDSTDPEIERVLLQISNGTGQEIYRNEFRINNDMWGWGFVKAMQVDADPELEIVFLDYEGRREISSHAKQQNGPFYLDVSTGGVETMDLTTNASDVLKLSDWWVIRHKPLNEIMFLILYYLIAFPLLVRLSDFILDFPERIRKVADSLKRLDE